MNTFKHLSYKEWIKEHPEVELEEEPCPECDGLLDLKSPRTEAKEVRENER